MNTTAKTKKQKQAHIIALFGAMINRIPVKVDGETFGNDYIQRINLDGECDIYNSSYKEVILEDISADRISL